MSYIKINEPVKRDKIVQDYILQKNRIKENFKQEHTQELNTAIAREKFFEPVTASQALTMEALKQLQNSVVLMLSSDGIIVETSMNINDIINKK